MSRNKIKYKIIKGLTIKNVLLNQATSFRSLLNFYLQLITCLHPFRFAKLISVCWTNFCSIQHNTLLN